MVKCQLIAKREECSVQLPTNGNVLLPPTAAASCCSTAEANPVVYVVDDDISVRESLEALIQASGWNARTFPSAMAFLESALATAPSCLILDVGLPDLSGLELQMRIAGRRDDLPIIFFTGYGDIPMTVQAMKAGAVEFLTKPVSDGVLLAAINAALSRSRAAVAEKATLLALRDRRATLSRREGQVMNLVVSGLLNKQAGGELGISEITVKAHRGRVMEKMQAKSFADLVRMSQRLASQ
jgi:FixJ family two-component response regulator